MKILAIDYGEKKIGLAVSEGNLVFPWRILPKTKDLNLKIKELCQNEGIGKIVVGFTEGKLAEKQKEFGEKLGQTLGLPVDFWEEALTSFQAVQKMIEAGYSRKRRRLEDAMAAALILQSYLEGHKDNLKA